MRVLIVGGSRLLEASALQTEIHSGDTAKIITLGEATNIITTETTASNTIALGGECTPSRASEQQSEELLHDETNSGYYINGNNVGRSDGNDGE
jgi:hypothetical protein